MTQLTGRARLFFPAVFLLSASLAVFGLPGCDSGPFELPPEPELADKLLKGEVAVGLSDNTAVPVVASHVDGAQLGVFGSDGLGAAEGIAYTTPEGRRMVIFLDNEGLPARAIIEDVVLVFGGYEEGTVDIAVVTPNGDAFPRWDIPTDEGFAAFARRGRSSVAASKSLSPSDPDFVSALRNLSLSASAAGCAIAVAAGTIGGGVPGAVAAASCGATILEALSDIYEVDIQALLDSQEAYEFSFFADAAGCVRGDGFDCVSFLSSRFADAFERGEEILEERKGDISRARKVLEPNGDNDGSGSTDQLIINPGFEDGEEGWAFSSDSLINSGDYPHDGSWYAIMGQNNNADDFLHQTVKIPEDIDSAQLIYWFNVTSDSPNGDLQDYLNVDILGPDGGILEDVELYTGYDKKSSPTDYSLKTLDVTHYAGERIRIYFSASTDGSVSTTFRIDDVELSIRRR